MDSCNTGDHTDGDHIHTDITTCNAEEPQQKYRHERLLGGREAFKLLFHTL